MIVCAKLPQRFKEGAGAYLNRQYTTIGMVGAILLVVIFFSPLGWKSAVGFAIGAILSGLTGYIGMNVSVRANIRTAEAANGGLNNALNVAFKGGAITGMLVVGLALLGVTGYYAFLTVGMQISSNEAIHALVSLAFGGSLISILLVWAVVFSPRVRTWALIWSVKSNLTFPKTTRAIRQLSPITWATTWATAPVMAADLFETYAVTIVATMLLGGLLITGADERAVLYPLVLALFDHCFHRRQLLRQSLRRRQDHERTVSWPDRGCCAGSDWFLFHHHQNDGRRRDDSGVMVTSMKLYYAR